MDEEWIPEGFKKIEDNSDEHVIFLTTREMWALVKWMSTKHISVPEDGYLIWKAFKKFQPILEDAYKEEVDRLKEDGTW